MTRRRAIASEIEKSLKRALESLTNRDGEIRCEAAAEIGELRANSGRAPRALIQALSDKSPLVRVAVLESLEAIRDKRACGAIVKLLDDPSSLVRCYAGTAVGVLATTSARRALADRVAREGSAIARVGLYSGLMLCGDRSALDALLKLLTSRQYRVRCAVANTVSAQPLSRLERMLVSTRLRAALLVENTIAARSSLEAALRELSRGA